MLLSYSLENASSTYEIIVTVVLSILLVKNLILIIGIAGYRLTVVGVVMYSEAKSKFK